MATVTPTFNSANSVAAGGESKVRTAVWAITTANSDGRGVEVTGYAYMNWQGVTAAAGGATLSFEGSNDGATWFPLTRVGGTTALTLTASGGGDTNEHPMFVRPNLTVVGAAAVWTVSLTATKS